uniref:Uncharacterized protein n=1 Tax=Opuntia streptacantha TaxID=393608 RepID=A0A7C8Z4A4_OPUST
MLSYRVCFCFRVCFQSLIMFKFHCFMFKLTLIQIFYIFFCCFFHFPWTPILICVYLCGFPWLYGFFSLVYIFGLFNGVEMGYVTVHVSIMMVVSAINSTIS